MKFFDRPFYFRHQVTKALRKISKESWPQGPGFGYLQREFALLKIY